MAMSLALGGLAIGGCGESALSPEPAEGGNPPGASSGATGSGGPNGTPGPTNTAPPGGSLVQTSGSYSASCDASGGVAIDGKHFLAFNDENQILRLYEQGGKGPAVQELDISESLGLATDDEADFEDAARVGNRVYVITSHGRKKTGKLDEARYKFFAIDVSGAIPSVGMKVAGVYSTLLEDMLEAKSWTTPNTDFLDMLDSTSQLSKATVADLAPKEGGTNIEGLAALPGGRLAIGFRNPKQNADAAVITLLNPDEVVAGSAAKFGEVIELNLDGLGIRGMAWSEVHQRVLITSGPHDETNGPYALWTWTGAAGTAPVKVMDLKTPDNAAPEAILPYPGTNDVQILFDMSTALIGGGECADAPMEQKVFTDLVVHVK